MIYCNTVEHYQALSEKYLAEAKEFLSKRSLVIKVVLDANLLVGEKQEQRGE